MDTAGEVHATRKDAIRLARCWAEGMSQRDCAWVYDWTPGPTYGARRETTWAEKRAAVMRRYDEAKAAIAHIQSQQAKRDRADKTHARELMILRQQRRDLEMKPLGVNIRPMQEEIDRKIAALIEAERPIP